VNPTNAKKYLPWCLLLIGLISFCWQFHLERTFEPQGFYDARDFWIPRAMALAQGNLPLALTTWHADYPLLWTAILILGWKLAGTIGIVIPAILAIGTSICTMILLCVSIWKARGAQIATFATGVMILLAYGFFAGLLTADLPLGLAYLLTLTTLTQFLLSNQRRWLWVSVISAGAAMNLKNEGAMFLVIYLAALLISRRLTWREWLIAVLILAPFLAAFIGWKAIAPTNDLIAGQGGDSLSRLLDANRYAVIAKHFAIFAALFGVQAFLVSYTARLLPTPDNSSYNQARLLIWLILAGMIAGYFMVYVMTPLPLEQHLLTSLDRLTMQLWPSVVFVSALAVRSPRRQPFASPVLQGTD